MSGTTSTAQVPKLSMLQRVTKLFKRKLSSKHEDRVAELETKLAFYRIELLEANQSNTKLVEQNAKLERTVEELKQKAIDAETILHTCSEAYLGTIERLSHEKNELVKEHALDKESLVRKVQSLHQVITELRIAESQQEKLQDLTKNEERLEEERKVVNDLRKNNKLLLKKQLAEEVKKNGESFGWQVCEICLEPFGNQKKNVPRVLACGHTFCHCCSEKMAEKDYIKCPLDRLCSGIQGSLEESLPKNYAVLNMCDL